MNSDARGSADNPFESEKSRAIGKDPEWNRVLDELIQEASLESHVTDTLLAGETVDRLCHVIGAQRGAIEDQLRTAYPEEDGGPGAFTDEAVATLVRIAFDHGFRVGRLFEARGFEVDL